MTRSIKTPSRASRRKWARAIPDRELDVILSMFGSGARAVRSVTLRAVVSVLGVLERERNRRERGAIWPRPRVRHPDDAYRQGKRVFRLAEYGDIDSKRPSAGKGRRA